MFVMAKKGLFFVVCFFVVSLTNINGEYKTTKEAMNEIFSTFVSLLPYASNEMRFNDPNAEAYIKTKLLKLKTAFKNAKHLKKISTPGFQPSFEIVTNHLEQTYENFSTQNKSFARTRLKQTAEMCISCHTQLPKGVSSTFRQFDTIKRDQFYNDYEYADYLFLIRNYSSAIVQYEKEIKSRLAKNKALRAIQNSKNTYYLDFTIEKSLKRILTIYTKVFYNPQKALTYLERYQGNTDLPNNLKNTLTNWVVDLKRWKKDSFDGSLKNEKEFDNFVKKHLDESEVDGDSSDVDFLVAAGALYRYVNRAPKSEKVPEVLFWLGRIDNELEHSYFYSLSELYLKNCIKNYPKSKFARKCYQQYKEILEIGFTGTSGTHIPKDELEVLNKLKSYLK